MSKYQIRSLFNPCKRKGIFWRKTKERDCSSSKKNSSKNAEPNLLIKVRTVLLCLRAKVLAHESRSIYFIRYKTCFFEDPL
uniref:Uncharacterized protein n=1 Tax=Phalaenopsis aphrodite subsp. formosana TaxID=308872 RepID=Q3BAR1_PHAAO|nr:hypothetical protein [Phalaenopsis aphrodite subsp. formosana]